MHDAERMFKSAVRGTRIDIVGPSKLLDPSKSLKWRLVDNPPFKISQANEAMHTAATLGSERIVQHVYLKKANIRRRS